MQVTMGVGVLRQALARALGVAGSKSTLPILGTVLLEAGQTPEGGRLTARAYDLEIEVVTEHACEVQSPGAVAVPAKALHEIAKALPSGSVQLKKASNGLEIVAGASRFRLAGLAVEDFPASPVQPSKVEWAPVVREALLVALDRVTYAMSSDESRYNLNGVHFDHADGQLALVCTDGHRMGVAELFGVPGYGLNDNGAIVGRKAVDELHKLLSEEGEPGDLAFVGGSLLYRRPGLRYTARLIDGQFPAWREVMPSVGKDTPPMQVDYHTLRDSLKRVLLMAQDHAASVTLALKPGLLSLRTRSPELGDATDEVEVAYVGPEREIALNGRLLADVVGVEPQPLNVHIGDELSPVLIAPVGKEGVRHVLMPMRR